VVHGFIRGISGAVVIFPQNNEPKLWLSSESELKRGDGEKWWRPRVFACTTCGQHYYVSFLKDFTFAKTEPEGGQLAEEGTHFWEALDANNGGKRAVLVIVLSAKKMKANWRKSSERTHSISVDIAARRILMNSAVASDAGL